MATKRSTYAIDGGQVAPDKSWVLAMRGRTRFSITVLHKEIDGTAFGEQYFALMEANRDQKLGVVWPEMPLRHICDYCLPTMKQLAPQSSFKDLTLEDLLHSPLYDLEVVRTNSQIGTHVVGGEKCSHSPALNMLPLKTVDLPPECHAVTRFAADQIRVDERSPSIGVQAKLPIPPEGRYMYFKPREAGREKQFDRELRILSTIKQKHLTKDEVRLSDLQGIVVSGEAEEVCIGVLIDMIPTSSFGTDLLSPGCWGHSDLHQKWEQQVTATVEVLHAHDIVWGDVNAGNVVIDQDTNAWVIDFGGMNNPEFVDDDKAETIEGYWQGVRRLFRKWLPKQKAINQ